MKYGIDFFVLDAAGRRVLERAHAYPRTQGFEYCDGTGDKAELLVGAFAVEFRVPGTDDWLRMTIAGDPVPVLHKNAFDFDWASIPKMCRWFTCDKADYRVRPGSVVHDMGFCVHEIWPMFTMSFWNNLLFEIMEAYSVSWDEVSAAKGVWAKAKAAAQYAADKTLRYAVLAGVTVGGPFVWKKSRADRDMYRGMIRVERIVT